MLFRSYSLAVRGAGGFLGTGGNDAWLPGTAVPAGEGCASGEIRRAPRRPDSQRARYPGDQRGHVGGDFLPRPVVASRRVRDAPAARSAAPHDAPTVKGWRSPVPPPTDTAVHNPPCARYSCTGYSCTPANACPHSPEVPWLVSSVPFYNATGPPQSGGARPSQPGSVHAGSRLLHRTLSLRADTSHCPQCLVWGDDTPLHATPTLLPPCGPLARPLHGQCRLRHQAPGRWTSARPLHGQRGPSGPSRQWTPTPARPLHGRRTRKVIQESGGATADSVAI